MECPSCGFQNIPGLKQCARCQSLLDLVGLSVEPPRARSGAVARATRVCRRQGNALSGRLAGVRECLRRSAPRIEGADPRALAWSLLPGMGQIVRGQSGRRAIGYIVLAVWAMAMHNAVISTGSPAATFWLMVALSVHGVGVGLVLAPALIHATLPLRLMIGILSIIVLQLIFYTPLTMIGDHFGTVVRLINIPESDIARSGDLLLVSDQWTQPDRFKRGDVVLFHMPRMTGQGWVMPEGPGVDRIVGMPHETVELKGGVLLINGKAAPSEVSPLGPTAGLPDMTWQPGEGEYVILPSLMANLGRPDLLQQALSTGTIVSEGRIEGQVLWRLRPWSRFGRVE